ncbi:MAG: DUF2500 domain-containing protein [Oscillibacter sp.]|nr:DUF2500 domain-containing protein [Oscillibacter sp.]
MAFGFGQVFIFAVFAIIIVSFIVAAVKGIGTWHKNNNSPRLTVDASVVSKRQNTDVHHHNNNGTMHTSSSTTYYATFQFDSGDRLELCVSGGEYGLLAEGDVGELTFQGTRYLGFDRRGTAEPASEEPPIRSTEKKSWDPEL